MFEKIQSMVAEQLGAEVSTITMDTNFKEDLGADSLDLFELVTALEEEYGISIPAEELEQLATVSDVVKYVEAHQ
ncbi:MAG: acyl carrier protein [Lachnospiraceae bacterium]|nr:acyl carrier protein [Lachnospiraceae bacterium]